MNGLGNTVFRPSKIEDHIYDYIEQPHFLCSSREYRAAVMEGVENYFNEFVSEQWNIIYDNYPDMTGASVSICWIEQGYLHHIILNIRY